jgi:NAD(P)-dependent dehydrogenase (short-subunit alcohol dehydrogenase family)
MRPRRLRRLDGLNVFITGAASGIGRATAEAVAAGGGRLFLTDIQTDLLSTTAAAIRERGGEVVVAEAIDVTDHDAVRPLAQQVTDEHGAMDVVMNIAGISAWGTVMSLEHETWRRQVEVNLMGPIHVIEELVPPMVEAGRGGHVVNVSSAAGIIGMPWHAAYSASKFGLRGVSEVLRFDLAQHGIGVSLVCPGAVHTPLTGTVQIAGVDTTSRRFRKVQARFHERAVSPEAAAEAILKGVRRNRYWVYTSPDIRLIHAVQRYCPPAYSLAMRVLNRAANRVLPEVGRARRVEG